MGTGTIAGRSHAVILSVIIGLLILCHQEPVHSQMLAQIEIGGIGSPTHLELIGTLYAPDAQPDTRKGFYILHILVDGKEKLIFDIEKGRNLTSGSTLTTILEQVFPPEVSTFGDEKAIEALKEPDIIGKRIMLEGYLYIGSHLFHVVQVESPPAKKSK